MLCEFVAIHREQPCKNDNGFEKTQNFYYGCHEIQCPSEITRLSLMVSRDDCQLSLRLMSMILLPYPQDTTMEISLKITIRHLENGCAMAYFAMGA